MNGYVDGVSLVKLMRIVSKNLSVFLVELSCVFLYVHTPPPVTE